MDTDVYNGTVVSFRAMRELYPERSRWGTYSGCCSVPGGTKLEIQVKTGSWAGPHTRNNSHITCTGVYCAWIVNNAVTSELYWVQLSGSWIHSFILTLIIQLHTKLLVTVRDTSAECNGSTRQLHIAGAMNI